LRQDAAGQAEEQAKVILAKANEDAKEVIHNARTEAEGERNKILAELRSQVAAISMAAANKLVGEALDEKRQRALLADFFAKVPDSVSGLSGSKAEVTSALPLTNEEMAQVKASIKAADVSFKVNPKILGGLIVRVDDRVVDNSVAGQMANLADSLK
jgi:F-type H+-transporting ATPase subunit b